MKGTHFLETSKKASVLKASMYSNQQLQARSELNLNGPASGELDAMLAAASRYATRVVRARRTTP